MVDESLVRYLQNKLGPSTTGNVTEHLRDLIFYNDHAPKFSIAEVDTLIQAIDNAKILDPASGSGAFPMGVLHKLVFILSKLDPRNEKWKQRQIKRVNEAIKAAEGIEDAPFRERTIQDLEQQISDINEAFERNELDYGRKLYLIENCIYGVDIQPIACQIAKLRFFISLVVDQRIDERRPNRGIRPMPNLETKFVAANTVINVDRPGQQLLRNLEIDGKQADLRCVRERHFLARTPATKAKYREQDAQLRREIAELLKKDGWDTTTASKLASWDPYDQNSSADFFEIEWMFGFSDGFDICLGNPPYAGKQALQLYQPNVLNYAKTHFESARGRDFDLFALFIEQSLRLTRVGGSICFIVPTGWYTGPGFSALRRLVATQTDPQVFINLPYDMFEEAWVDTTVFLAIRRNSVLKWPRQEQAQVSLRNFGKREWISSQNEFYENCVAVDIAEWFRNGSDEFLTRSDENVLRLLAKIQGQSTSLGMSADVQRGVTPFVVTERAKHPNSRRAFNGSLRRYSINYGPVRYIRFDDSLAEFKAARYFEGKRILLRELISRQMRLQATIVEEDFVTNKSIQSILPKPGGPDLGFLLGVLNSRLMSWYFLQRSNVGHRDDFPKIVLKETRDLPISLPADSHLTDRIAHLVNHIVAIRQTKGQTDISEFDGEIDQLVYSLYGLTVDEIRIVEEAASGKAAGETGLRNPAHEQVVDVADRD